MDRPVVNCCINEDGFLVLCVDPQTGDAVQRALYGLAQPGTVLRTVEETMAAALAHPEDRAPWHGVPRRRGVAPADPDLPTLNLAAHATLQDAEQLRVQVAGLAERHAERWDDDPRAPSDAFDLARVWWHLTYLLSRHHRTRWPLVEGDPYTIPLRFRA